MKASHNKLAEKLTTTNNLLEKTRQELELQKIYNIRLEAHSRRNNIKFVDVQETITDGSYMETKVMKELLLNQLKMNKIEVDSFEFEWVHHVSSRQTSDDSPVKPHPITAQLNFFKDKGHIFKHAKNTNRQLKIGVACDYPRGKEEIRKALLPVLKKSQTE